MEREHERDNDEGGDGHNVPIPRKGTFFWVKVPILTPSLPSLAVPPFPLNTPNTKNTPYQCIFCVWLVHLHPKTPSSSQTPQTRHCGHVCGVPSSRTPEHEKHAMRHMFFMFYGFTSPPLHPNTKIVPILARFSCLGTSLPQTRKCNTGVVPPPFPPPSTTQTQRTQSHSHVLRVWNVSHTPDMQMRSQCHIFVSGVVPPPPTPQTCKHDPSVMFSCLGCPSTLYHPFPNHSLDPDTKIATQWS